jgi:SAM-dependent methyltransferase
MTRGADRPPAGGRIEARDAGAATPFSPLVVWHDVECGGYRADLPLWRELAGAQAGPVLDVGAGTGRVALELARAGHAVTALDREPELLAALAERARAAGLHVETVVADAAGFALERRFALVIVPMQTVQLLGEPKECQPLFRLRFFRSARAALRPGGLLALAITGALEGFEGLPDELLPHPDVGEVAGWRFASQPVAVRKLAHATRIERVRRATSPDGGVTVEDDAIELARVTVAQLDAEGRAAGFAPEPPRSIAATADHVGTEVVLLRA